MLNFSISLFNIQLLFDFLINVVNIITIWELCDRSCHLWSRKFLLRSCWIGLWITIMTTPERERVNETNSVFLLNVIEYVMFVYQHCEHKRRKIKLTNAESTYEMNIWITPITPIPDMKKNLQKNERKKQYIRKPSADHPKFATKVHKLAWQLFPDMKFFVIFCLSIWIILFLLVELVVNCEWTTEDYFVGCFVVVVAVFGLLWGASTWITWTEQKIQTKTEKSCYIILLKYGGVFISSIRLLLLLLFTIARRLIAYSSSSLRLYIMLTCIIP